MCGGGGYCADIANKYKQLGGHSWLGIRMETENGGLPLQWYVTCNKRIFRKKNSVAFKARSAENVC